MKSISTMCVAGAIVLFAAPVASAQNLLINGNLDKVQVVEIVPGFFAPKPATWVNEGFRAITGPYEDEMTSEPWAGPAPTPVTADGFGNPPPYNTNPDWGVFFKPFSGNVVNGAATGHLYQDVPGAPGVSYKLTGWAGAEANALMTNAVFVIEFRTGGGALIQTVTLSLLPKLFVDNGQPFDYKKYTLIAVAPPGTAKVRARALMIGGTSNPSGGGQAFVVDDFSLTDCPADLNDDGVVDGADIAIVLGSWGPCPGCVADINGDGVVDGADVALVLGAWGICPS